MNRKQRRAAAKREPARSASAGSHSADPAGLFAQAQDLHRLGRHQAAKDICKRILTSNPSHVPALNLLGLIYQQSGEHPRAVKTLEGAIAADELNAACHYNLASSYLALQRPQDAERHFKRSIALGMSQRNVEDFILQNPDVARLVAVLEEPRPTAAPPFSYDDFQPIFADVFFRCALATAPLRGVPLETLLSLIRRVLLDQAKRASVDDIDADAAAFFCALAQQCFINEYVFDQSESETSGVNELRDRLERHLRTGQPIPPLQLIAVAAYVPLHAIASSRTLPGRNWPEFIAPLLTQQVKEPFAELDDRSAIPALTAVNDITSIEVMQQYAENPYPRWNTDVSLSGVADAADDDTPADILVAGCGTGRHSCHVARQFPDARILAVDLSIPSLAYARRKTREASIGNVEYAQADLLKLGSLGRSFDRIEAIGVLHHLSSPEAGWETMLSLLRANGRLRVGLYSETARREIVKARQIIQEKGYRATPEGIRKCRSEIAREQETGLWRRIIASADFYSMSGCRDLLFNVVEHRFNIQRIRALLSNARLSFLGFELDPATSELFKQRYPDPDAWYDLDRWEAFETEYPNAFRYMYVFTVERRQTS